MNGPCGVGDRVRAAGWHVDREGTVDPTTGLIRDREGTIISVDDNVTVPPGTEGTVTEVTTDPSGKAFQIYVSWANDRTLPLLPEVDRYEVLSE